MSFGSLRVLFALSNLFVWTSHGYTEVVSSSGTFVGVYAGGPITWQAARSYCQNSGNDLATINSASENSEALSAALSAGAKVDIWLGMNDVNTEDRFVWADGSPVVYTNWRRGEPNDYRTGEDCAAMYTTGLWNDLPCDPVATLGRKTANTFVCRVGVALGELICDDPYECEGDSIIANNTRCYGYYSCKGASIESESIDCKGMGGCYNATQLVSTDGDIHCDGYNGCYGAINGISATNGDIYCDGERSCYQVSGDIIANSDDKDVYCNGEESCYGGSVISINDIECNGEKSCYESVLQAGDDILCHSRQSCYKSTMASEDDIYCEGEESCYGALIDSKDDIECNGYKSCYESVLKSAEYITCDGTESCYDSSIISTDSYISCYGRRACYGSSLQAGNFVDCESDESCSGASINAVNDVDCNGDKSCYTSNIKTTTEISCEGDISCYESTLVATDEIHCTGDYSCYKSSIITNNNIYCDGPDSCRRATLDTNDIHAEGGQSAIYATINNAEIVYAYGYRSFMAGDWIVESDKTAELRAYGHNAGSSAEITCQAGAICDIKCQGNGCDEMDVYCDTNATCTYECDDANGVTCPNRYDITLSLLTKDDPLYQKKQQRYEIKEKYTTKMNELMTQYSEIDNKISNSVTHFNGKYKVSFKQQQKEIMEQIENIDLQMESELTSLYNKYNNNNNNINSNEYNNKLTIPTNTGNNYNLSEFKTITIFIGVFVAPLVSLYFIYLCCMSHCNNKDKYQDYEIL